MLSMKLRNFAGSCHRCGITILCACSFLLFASTLLRSSNAAPSPPAQRTASQGAAQFAIADFDGDLQPDLASIRVTRQGARNAEYALDLQFSSGPRPAISILGPSGGLQLTSQDVNGDEFADLVVTSLLDSQFVAILLNDGSGHFHVADRANFPEAGKRVRFGLSTSCNSSTDQATLGQGRGSQGEVGNRINSQKPRPQSAGRLLAPRITALSVLARASAGRAPPFV